MDSVKHYIKSHNNKIGVETYQSQQAKNISNVFRMWRITINFLYYFGAIPFKCEYCKTHQHWYLKTSKMQKVFHLIYTTLLISIKSGYG